MSFSTFQKALDLFLPRLAKDFSVVFYGGEPLLASPFIRQAVRRVERVGREHGLKPSYAVTTNGSRVTDEMARFFAEHRFSVEVSFDGLAQETSRQRGSSAKVMRNIRKLLACPGIDLEVNCTFTPATVHLLGESAEFILGLGVPSVQVSLAATERWPRASLKRLRMELGSLRAVAVDHDRKTGRPGIANFERPPGKGLFYCAAGQDRFAIAPDGGIWGCFLFPGYLHGKEGRPEHREYYCGNVHEPALQTRRRIRQAAANYSRLSLDNFLTSRGPCLFCREFENCAVCPVAASLSGSPLGRIPDDVCRIQRCQIRERRAFVRTKTLRGHSQGQVLQNPHDAGIPGCGG